MNTHCQTDFPSLASPHRQRLLVVEDHEIVRDAFCIMLQSVAEPSAEILVAGTWQEASSIILRHSGSLSLVLVDLNLPDSSEDETVRRLKSLASAPPFLVVSASENWDLAARCLTDGANGFLPKTSGMTVMLNALRLILAGGRYFPEQVFDYLASLDNIKHKPNHDAADIASLVDLPPRQREALILILDGLSNKEIARRLNVSVGTAKNYVSAILRQCNASSRGKAVSILTSQLKILSESSRPN